MPIHIAASQFSSTLTELTEFTPILRKHKLVDAMCTSATKTAVTYKNSDIIKISVNLPKIIPTLNSRIFYQNSSLDTPAPIEQEFKEDDF